MRGYTESRVDKFSHFDRSTTNIKTTSLELAKLAGKLLYEKEQEKQRLLLLKLFDFVVKLCCDLKCSNKLCKSINQQRPRKSVEYYTFILQQKITSFAQCCYVLKQPSKQEVKSLLFFWVKAMLANGFKIPE